MGESAKQRTVGSRLHFALLDLGSATQRIFGGSGLALQHPRSVLEWRRTGKGEPSVDTLVDLDATSLQAIEAALQRLSTRAREVHGVLRIRSIPPQHVGLGVTTALVLGGLHLVNEREKLGLSRAEMEALSGRGGASGVGLAAFFDGGFVVDAGHPRKGPVQFLPSGAGLAHSLPVRVGSYPLPREWQIRLLLPNGRRWSGPAEVEFFERHTPIPDDEVLAGIAATYHAVLPGICESDLALLKEGLRVLNATGFKAREVASHGRTVRALIDDLDECTPAAVGMSSMGPLVFLVGPPNVLLSASVAEVIGDHVVDLGTVRASGQRQEHWDENIA